MVDWEDVFSYQSVRLIRVKNLKLSLIYWLFVASVLAYVVGYSIIVEKGYQVRRLVPACEASRLALTSPLRLQQAYEPLEASIMTKVKGSAHTGAGDKRLVFDTNDLVVPAMIPR